MAETLNKLVHFPHEQYVIETMVKQRVPEPEIALAMLAHLKGEGESEEFERVYHALEFRQNFCIRSEHSVLDGARLLIITECDRGRTTVKLIDES